MTQESVNWTAITGSTGGIGSEIVKLHAARGDAMILINRSKAKAEAQLTNISIEYPKSKIELVSADLMDIDSIKSATDRINAIPGRIDALYNNSGVLTAEKKLSVQGFESHFAVNTLAPYQIIRNLNEKMWRPEDERPAIVINFSSSAISGQKKLELENLQDPDEVGGLMSTYAQTKLAVTLLAPALAKELKQGNILIRAIDPGATKTAMTTGGNSGMPWILSWVAPLLFSPANKQAAKIVKSADPSAFGGASGIYVANMREKKIPSAATDKSTQQRLIDLLDRSLASF